MNREMMKSEKSGYDLYSAVTFLLIGLGLGTVFAMIFNPCNHKKKQRSESRDRLGTADVATFRSATLIDAMMFLQF